MNPAALRERPAPSAAGTKVNIIQGEYYVTDDDGTMLTTLLGSCVAACLTDRVAGVGGMNHFLLPGDDGAGGARDGGMRHGVHAMELLMNGLLRLGARRDRLEARLFGGARMLSGLTEVGTLNAEFAERFIRRERIAMVGGSLRGDRGRRIQFWPTLGKARQMTISNDDSTVLTLERRAPAPSPEADGSVELF